MGNGVDVDLGVLGKDFVLRGGESCGVVVAEFLGWGGVGLGC